jgi:hypothetical protein
VELSIDLVVGGQFEAGPVPWTQRSVPSTMRC